MGKLIQMLPGKDAIAEANEFFLRAVEIARDDPHAAILLYKEAIQRCRAKMDNAFLNLGTLYFEMRDFEKAEEYYKEALEVNPDNAPAHFNLGNICDEWGQHQEAAKFYAQAIQLDPSYADAHYNFALLCEHVNLQMEAIKHWRAYIKLDPSSLWSDVARRQLQSLLRDMLIKPTVSVVTETMHVDCNGIRFEVK